MALSFKNLNGSAKKGGSYMKLEEGENSFRRVGNILPRYLYWVTNAENKQLPFECLGFDRQKEKFTNIEKDWVQATVKDPKTGEPVKCGWAYVVQVINRKTGKLEILNLKKKMFESLISYCQEIESDPTDQETGFDIILERKKTGAFAYNVEYILKIPTMMKHGSSALSPEDLELIKDMKPIEEVVPRPTPEEQKAALDAFLSGKKESDDNGAETDSQNEAVNELDAL